MPALYVIFLSAQQGEGIEKVLSFIKNNGLGEVKLLNSTMMMVTPADKKKLVEYLKQGVNNPEVPIQSFETAPSQRAPLEN